jgi:[methyl-Co(III) methanol-specific corrinoid protein]:coenzyme M methyltransferase
MMNAAVVGVMETTGHALPEGHHDAQLMSEISSDVRDYTGFENLGIPFCMTVEAEVLGSEINFGTLACEPKIERELFPNSSGVIYRGIDNMLKSGRIGTIIDAGHKLSKIEPDLPIIGNLTGPISTAASIVDPIIFLKELRKDREHAHKVLDYVSDLLIGFAREMIDNGVTLISIGDPTATGEILGPKMFEEYAVRYINKIIDAIHKSGAPVIVHICGDMKAVRQSLPNIRSNAISTDALVNLRQLKEDFPGIITMGNVSTYLLEFGDAEKVAKNTERLVLDGVDIISPACGLSTSTSIENIRALTGTVKER